MVDRAASVSANRTNIESATRNFRNSHLALLGVYPSVAFPGEPALPPTYDGMRPPSGPAGNVLTQSNKLQDGVFDATVTARRRAVVLLKATYDPRWTVTVDGQHAKPEMMAPSLVGVEVPPVTPTVRADWLSRHTAFASEMPALALRRQLLGNLRTSEAGPEACARVEAPWRMRFTVLLSGWRSSSGAVIWMTSVWPSASGRAKLPP